MRDLPGRIVFVIFLQRTREGVARHEKFFADGRESEGRTSPQSDYLFVTFAREARYVGFSPTANTTPRPAKLRHSGAAESRTRNPGVQADHLTQSPGFRLSAKRRFAPAGM